MHGSDINEVWNETVKGEYVRNNYRDIDEVN